MPDVILVVDDEQPIRRAARRILEMDGYHVLEADNGASGLAVLEGDASVDFLIADLAMPELTGDEMARRIRRTRPDLKVLYVTGFVDRLMNERPILWEGEAFLEKPFTAKGLIEAVSLLRFGTLRRPNESAGQK
jgi:two-component system, cell cycle sensor histidine kinase and response regulator CckA